MKRSTMISEKISSFMEEGKMIKSSKTNLLLIERIIDFIDNEFPEKKKIKKLSKYWKN